MVGLFGGSPVGVSCEGERDEVLPEEVIGENFGGGG